MRATFRGFFGRAAVAVLFLAGRCAPSVMAIEPVSHFHDLVAGDGVAGFRDGEFQRARFRAPAALAVLARRGLLVVADRDNHRIRAIRWNDANRVETLAGSGSAGRADGVFAAASFHSPSAVVAISEDAVLVDDEGSALFRRVDLATGRVETIAGSGRRGLENGPAREAALGDIWSLLFVPVEQAVYFTQPEQHSLRRLDLRSRAVSTVLLNDPRLSRPTALALLGGTICVADRDGAVLRLGPAASGAPRSLEPVGQGERILSMAASGDTLYATQGTSSSLWTRITGGGKRVLPVALPDASPVPWLKLDEEVAGGFAADPRGDRAFFLTTPSLQAVVSLKDYSFGGPDESTTDAGEGLIDFSYPLRKPARTFRILVLGESHVDLFHIAPSHAGLPEPGQMETMPKRLELFLNSLSALENGGLHVQVLSLTRNSWQPLLVWTNYHAVEVVRKYDVDLVLLMQPPDTNTIEAYLERPIASTGVPAETVDPEYLLRPLAEKIRDNPAGPLLDRARKLGWAYPRDQNQVSLAPLSVLITDETARRKVLELLARPLVALRAGILGASKGTAFVLCYFPMSHRGSGVLERDFWRELAAESRVGWLDLLDAFVALRDTWYPYSEGTGYDHFTPQGHAFFAFVTGHELLGSGWVPFRRDAATVRDRPPPQPQASSAARWDSGAWFGVPVPLLVVAGILLGWLGARALRR